MPERQNDPRKLEDWMVKVDQRLRELEARRLDAGDGTQIDHATKTVSAKISEDPNNSAAIGEDGGIKATDTVTSAADHTPLFIYKHMTAGQSINNTTDTLVSWGFTYTSGTWTSDATSITIPEDGIYHVTFSWQWANNATGIRAAHMTVNSTVVTTGSRYASTLSIVSNNEAVHNFGEPSTYTAGDILRIYVFQSSGAALSGGGPYFGDIRGRWTVTKVFDSYPPALEQSTA